MIFTESRDLSGLRLVLFPQDSRLVALDAVRELLAGHDRARRGGRDDARRAGDGTPRTSRVARTDWRRDAVPAVRGQTTAGLTPSAT